MSAAALTPTQRDALLACATAGELRRGPGHGRAAYRAPGLDGTHDPRAVHALSRLAPVAFDGGESRVIPTHAGRVAAAALQPNRSNAA